ncbi:actin-like protein arp8 [Ceratobasidium sp. 370]|nr:actin-like protein arp8 [Ceratobasidium sp. 370]
MARGTPVPKRDEVPMKFTAFHIPPVTNTKNVSSSYLKTDAQTIWARNAAQAQRKRTADEAFTGKEKALPNIDSAPGAKTVVIHPGSRWLKIGMASDVFPVSIPNVIARKQRIQPVPPPVFYNAIIKPASETEKPSEREASADAEEPFVERTASIRSSLLARMKFYKLQVLPNASSEAARFNANYKPTTIADHNDPYRVEWLGSAANPITTEEYFIGEKALSFGDPEAAGFTVKWPMRGNSLNTRDYDSAQAIISDIETIWTEALRQELKISRPKYKDLSVILVIPDYYDRFYVRELVNVLLVQMGFAQESLCAAFGAGLSTACVVDIGAVKTSIACVDEGQVVPDTRITLDFGGDDITEYLYYLLKGINLPYHECELNRMQVDRLDGRTWNSHTLQTDVALNLYDFDVRRPGHITQRYTLQVYDEPVLAAMCIFEPRIIDFDAKRATRRLLWTPENVEDIPDFSSDVLTQAMLISTQHLLPPQPALFAQVPQLDGAHGDEDTEMDVRADELSASEKHRKREKESSPEQRGQKLSSAEEIQGGAGSSHGDGTEAATVRSVSPTQPPPPSASTPTSRARTPGPVPVVAAAPVSIAPPVIDVRWEASKLPLDVAIFNSARAAGGVDRIKKFLQVVVVVGGTSMIPGMVHALESRLQAIAFPLVPGMEKVQVVPAPKDIDPRVLSWKGAAVLAKLEALNDMWISGGDWDMLGMRALRERTLFIARTDFHSAANGPRLGDIGRGTRGSFGGERRILAAPAKVTSETRGFDDRARRETGANGNGRQRAGSTKCLSTSAAGAQTAIDPAGCPLSSPPLSILALCSAPSHASARLFQPLPALHVPVDTDAAGRRPRPPLPSPYPARADRDDRTDATAAPPLAGAYPASADMPSLAYPYQAPDPPYASRAPSAAPAYTDDRRVSSSSAGSYEHAYPYNYRQYPPRATSPMIARGSLPYEYPLDSNWSRRPSAEQSPAPSAPPRAYDDQYHDDAVPPLAQSQLAYPHPLDHHSPMQSLGSSSSNSTGIPASPDLALQPSGMVAPLSEGPTAPSAQNPGQRTYAFVSLAGSTIRKRPRRRYDEIERLYSCSFEDCTKAYGTLNHLNAHVTMQKHGPKRNPSEFKELRKLWRSQKKAEQMQNRPRRRRGVGQDDDDPRALQRTASGSYSTDPESDDGTPQPGEYGSVDHMWSQGMVQAGNVPAHMGEMRRYDDGQMYHPEHDPHMGGQHLMGPDQAALERIPPNATLLQGLPQSHPSQQPQQFSSPHLHPMAGYGAMPMSGNPPMNMRRASDQGYDYRSGQGPAGPYGR